MKDLWFNITIVRQNILLGAIYRPPIQNPANDAELLQKICNASAVSDAIIIAGDFNMPSINWPITEILNNNTPEALLSALVCDTNLHKIVTNPTRYRHENIPYMLEFHLYKRRTNDK